MNIIPKSPSPSKRQLRLIHRLAYSVGHFYNDLCASMWFSYLLVFFQYLLGFESDIAGYVLLLGQIVDAISTPFIGIASDKTTRFFCYGKRKGWHLLGTVLVSISFPFLYLRCINCADAWHWYQFIYYGIFVTVFQFGWASVQIAHMSIVNSLTSDESERVEMYAWRNANTLVASMLVYGIAWALLGRDENTKLGPDDVPKFMILMLIVIGVGLFFSILYHVGVKEKREVRIKRESDMERDEWREEKEEVDGVIPTETDDMISDSKNVDEIISNNNRTDNQVNYKSSNSDITQGATINHCDREVKKSMENGKDGVKEEKSGSGQVVYTHNMMFWKDWLKEWQFYMVGIQYMMSRLVFTVTQTYWPILVTETLQLEKKYTAVVPMVICVAGFVASLGMRPLNKRLGRKLTMALGLGITCGGLIGVWFLPRHSLYVFAPAVVVGVGTNTLIVSSLSMAADIIGNHVRSSAFVYGAMSLTDKISSGVAIVLIQQFIPHCVCTDLLQQQQSTTIDTTTTEICCEARADYFKNVMAFVPIGCIVVCAIGLIVMIPMKLGQLRKYVDEADFSGSSRSTTSQCRQEHETATESLLDNKLSPKQPEQAKSIVDNDDTPKQ